MPDQPLAAPPRPRYVPMGCAGHWTVFDSLRGLCMTRPVSEAQARACATAWDSDWIAACLRYLTAEWSTP